MARLGNRSTSAEALATIAEPEAAALTGLDSLELPTTGRRPWIEEAPRRSASPNARIPMLRPLTKSCPSIPDTPLNALAFR